MIPLQESQLDTIHGRHRVRFGSDHHTHQHHTANRIFTNIILSCASGKVILLRDFNIHFFDTSGFAYKRFVDIFETFDFVQHIDKPTHFFGRIFFT